MAKALERIAESAGFWSVVGLAGEIIYQKFITGSEFSEIMNNPRTWATVGIFAGCAAAYQAICEWKKIYDARSLY